MKVVPRSTKAGRRCCECWIGKASSIGFRQALGPFRQEDNGGQKKHGPDRWCRNEQWFGCRFRTPLRDRGTILFTGASGSLRGKALYAAFASAKAGLRAVSQSMAREFGPKGIHVAHVIIDGGISGDRLKSRFPNLEVERGADGLLSIDAIAETYWQSHLQHRSAWTLEQDLRPWTENF